MNLNFVLSAKYATSNALCDTNKLFYNKINHIDGSHLYVLPGLVDPHVHFRVPGEENKEDWKSGFAAAISSGITTVIDMPNNKPPTTTMELLMDKKDIIDSQLEDASLKFRYKLYFGATNDNYEEINNIGHKAAGIKVFLGASTGGLIVDNYNSLEQIFKIAAKKNLIVAVHAEDEQYFEKPSKDANLYDYSLHEFCRNKKSAISATEKAIFLAKKYSTRLYILHISTKEEIDLIKSARKDKSSKIKIKAETTHNHLFFDDSFYSSLGSKIVVNPPIRKLSDKTALIDAIANDVIDVVASDHAPHLIGDKSKPYGTCPSGIPGIETLLHVLIDLYKKNKISLSKLTKIASDNARNIFRLPYNSDFVLVDLNAEKKITKENLKTKCGWSPYENITFTGVPVCTFIRGIAYLV